MSRHATESRPYGEGKDFTFHGKFKSKILAARREREIPGAFVFRKGEYYFVMKPKTKTVSRRRNPNRATLIYDKITRIEGTKGADSNFAGERFFHNFKRPYPQMWGLPDGTLLIKGKK